MDKGRVKNRAYIVSDSILSPLGLGTDENMRRVSLYQSGVTEIDDKSLIWIMSEEITRLENENIMLKKAILKFRKNEKTCKQCILFAEKQPGAGICNKLGRNVRAFDKCKL